MFFPTAGHCKAESNASHVYPTIHTNQSQSTWKRGITLTPANESIYHSTWIDFNKNSSKDDFEDRTIASEVRVDDLLSQMTIEEKTCQLATLYGYQRVLKDDLPSSTWKSKVWKDGIANIDEHLNGIPGWRDKKDSEYVWPASKHARAINEVQRWFVEETRLGIPVDFTNEGIRGVCHRYATNFPAQIGVGASWDRKLVSEIGRITGTEAKCLGYTNIYSPILDLARDPRWGRVVECYGEDPYHVSELGLAQIQGLRKSGVAATCKHYAVYSVPKGGRDGHARTDPHVTSRELLQMYLKPFEVAIRKGGILGVMSSYNDYDSVPVSASREMLTEQLRDRMGFQGYVVSDSDAVLYLHSKHRVATSYQDAVKQFLEAGGNVRTEFNSPSKFITAARQLVASGTVSHEVVDNRVREVLQVKFELGLFDQPYVLEPDEADQIVHCKEHQDTALLAAQKSIVLLKNAEELLPLNKDLRSILVCGPNAQAIGPCVSRYGPTMGPVKTVLEGIREAVSEHTEVTFAKGCEVVDDTWPESELFPQPPTEAGYALIEDAVTKAKEADVVIVVLGESEHTIGESKSRTDLNLTGFQDLLVQSLHETGKPIVVVLLNGRALAINWIDRYVPAVLDAWFPGEATGQAVADVLFGNYNPGGKLPITFPRSVGQLPFNFPFKPGSQSGQGDGHNPNGVGNSRVTGALYPFGHGLSYTTFEYSDLRVFPGTISPGAAVSVSCTVQNTGNRVGEEVIQVYVQDDYSSVITYDRKLAGFERISLAAGESKTISIDIDKESLELINRRMDRVVEPGSFTVFVGSSSEDIRLQGAFEVIKANIASKE